MLSIRLAWRNIWRNKRRTQITTLSIIVAVFLSAVTRSTQEGQYENMIESTVGSFTGYVQLQKTGYWDDPTLENSFIAADSLMDLLEGHPSVTAVVPRLQSFALASTEQQSHPAMVIGIDVAAEKMLSAPHNNLTGGTYFQSNREASALLGRDLFNRMNAQIGDSLVLIGQGFRGVMATGLYRIRGVVSYPSPELNSSLVFLPLETAREFLGAPGRLTTAALTLDDPVDTDRVVRDLNREFDEKSYDILSWRSMMPGLVQAIQADRGSGIIILFVLYMVVGFGILGTVLMMITERTYEFGVMLSVGTPRKTLAEILGIEVFFMALMGSVIGIIASIPVCWYFNANPIHLTGEMSSVVQDYGMEPVLQFSVNPSVFTSQVIIVFLITLLFSIIPVIKAARLNPVEAMRS